MLVNFVRACVGQWAIAKFLAGRRGLEGAQNFLREGLGVADVLPVSVGPGKEEVDGQSCTHFWSNYCQLVVATVVDFFQLLPQLWSIFQL